MEWLEPWSAVEGKEKQRLTHELQREICVGHLLDGVPTEVVGQSMSNDDILVRLQHSHYQFAVVHLTWHSENLPEWPATKFYLDSNDFVDNKMRIDNYGH